MRSRPLVRKSAEDARGLHRETGGHWGDAVRTSEGKTVDFRRLFDQHATSDDRGLMVLTSQRLIVEINPAARGMFAFDGDLPVPIGDVVRDMKVSFAVGDAIHDRRAVQSETFLPGPERILRVRIVPVIWGDGSSEHILVTFEDVTRLRHLETVRRDFVANVSHELRTPIASINLLVETLQSLAFGHEPEVARFLRRIQTEAGSMNHLVDELLQLSLLESGRLSLSLETAEIGGIAEAVVGRLSLMAADKGVTLEAAIQPDLPPILVDSSAVEQVLTNLAHNAIKFTPEGGSIQLRARAGHPGVEVEVADTGIGMEPAEAARIFERFYKVDKGRQRESGTGLGLAIAKHLLELHGSRLHVVSEPSRGSRFIFKLPAAT